MSKRITNLWIRQKLVNNNLRYGTAYKNMYLKTRGRTDIKILFNDLYLDDPVFHIYVR